MRRLVFNLSEKCALKGWGVLSFRKNFDLSVYFVADPSLCEGRDIVDVVMQAAQYGKGGGVTMVQLRDKGGDKSQTLMSASMLVELLRPFNIPLIIDDDPDIAFAAGAAGVHLGQGDMKPQEARSILGEDAIIGQTAFTEDQIRVVNPEVTDYIGLGPFYITQTKKGKDILGTGEKGSGEFAKIAALSPVPVVGIGGITPENAADVIKAGAQGVAMMRSISAAPDPQIAAQQFTKVLKPQR